MLAFNNLRFLQDELGPEIEAALNASCKVAGSFSVPKLNASSRPSQPITVAGTRFAVAKAPMRSNWLYGQPTSGRVTK